MKYSLSYHKTLFIQNIFLLLHQIANSMEQSPWKGNCSACPGLLWNKKVHYHAHMSLPQELILSQINPVHSHSPYFLRSILYSPVFQVIVFFLVSLPKFCYVFLICAMHTTCCAYLILADLIILICGAEYKLCISSLHNFLQLLVTFSLLCPNILHSTLFSNTVFLYTFCHLFLYFK
jgi:hypothetical protein